MQEVAGVKSWTRHSKTLITASSSLHPGHIEEPWLMYEAGAISKLVKSSRVVPYCVGMEPTDIPNGPLSRFQGKRANREETLQLLENLSAALADAGEGALADAQLQEIFSALWPKLDAALQSIPAVEAKPKARGVDDMTKEILEIVRGIDRAVAATSSATVPDQSVSLWASGIGRHSKKAGSKS
ncbi:MAG TPA: hypothetical protein VN706_05335 [Gemmatimonadaceae bacterium]|nr:hypothetical protein [Gemmatimonadaceae bacterium]